MSEIFELRNSVLPYPWGSRSRIAKLLGEQVPAPEPQAELWMGAHPKAPSCALVDGASRRLDELIAERPVEILGQALGKGPQPQLPFLLKVLAAKRALSIQAHPNREQARAGFAREEALGLPRDAEERNYRDDNHKPEILVAVESFAILRGFRPPEEILRLAEQIGLEALLPALAALRQDAESSGLETFFAATLALEESEQLNRSVVQAIVQRGLAQDPVYSWVLRLAGQFPGDRGVLGPLFLNLLNLEPGEAIFTGPGILHAYLEGFGVELMASSDNVLRGGLTTKHVDIEELLSIVRFESQKPELLLPEIVEGAECYAPAVEDFALGVLRLEAGKPQKRRGEEVEILFALRGEGRITEASGNRRDFNGGDSFLVPASAGAYRLEGEATVFRATPGQPIEAQAG